MRDPCFIVTAIVLVFCASALVALILGAWLKSVSSPPESDRPDDLRAAGSYRDPAVRAYPSRAGLHVVRPSEPRVVPLAQRPSSLSYPTRVRLDRGVIKAKAAKAGVSHVDPWGGNGAA